ncbi:DUF2127 domain-containing protein [Nakamurella sp. YIM 132087]|uniref:DUF2127 domain-containing protein n=1 Tax=Nakamurella alba TaxID=2665158 RepID=A0A7K1FIR9_9ACTN|nr:DUF2127 domain-containing protein [Nakamurella alba]
MDWNLSTCGRSGHATYAPDEPELRARLEADTPAGHAWRCLRCGTFVPGAPAGSGPAAAAPEVPRGRLLRDRRIMRLLAAERLLRALVLLLAGVLVLVFRDRIGALRAGYEKDLGLLAPLAGQLGWNVQDSKVVQLVDRAFTLSPTTLVWVGLALLAYAALLTVESVGLWLVRRWGEYFSVVATGIFLPLEIYELTERVTWLKVLLFLVNLAAVLWLVWSKRLFGARGGGAEYRREHETESLLTVERSAGER